MMNTHYCLLVPHYNHAEQFVAFWPKLEALGLPVIVIDDGSNQESLAKIESLCETSDLLSLLHHSHNRGKGAAVVTGFYHAHTQGFSYAIQIDADGQHDTNDVAALIEMSQQQPQAMICGQPVFDDSAPKARVYGRKVTDFWVALETLSLDIKDSLCGYRIFPLKQMFDVLDNHYIGNRMDFDTDIIVKSHWQGVDIQFLETHVIYPEQGVSHFNYWRDNVLLIKLHTRLMVGMLVRAPLLLYKKFAR